MQLALPHLVATFTIVAGIASTTNMDPLMTSEALAGVIRKEARGDRYELAKCPCNHVPFIRFGYRHPLICRRAGLEGNADCPFPIYRCMASDIEGVALCCRNPFFDEASDTDVTTPIDRDTVDANLKAAIHRRDQEFNTLLAVENWKGASEMFTTDAIRIAPGVISHGRQAIEQVYESYHIRNVIVTTTMQELVAVGNWAFEVLNYTIEAGNETMRGYDFVVWRKINEVWLMQYEVGIPSEAGVADQNKRRTHLSNWKRQPRSLLSRLKNQYRRHSPRTMPNGPPKRRALQSPSSVQPSGFADCPCLTIPYVLPGTFFPQQCGMQQPSQCPDPYSCIESILPGAQVCCLSPYPDLANVSTITQLPQGNAQQVVQPLRKKKARASDVAATPVPSYELAYLLLLEQLIDQRSVDILGFIDRRDWKSMSDVYTEDATKLYPGKMLKGRPAILAELNAVHAVRPPRDIVTTPIALHAAGLTWAVELSNHTATVETSQSQAGGGGQRVDSTNLIVWEKLNGVWYIRFDAEVTT